MSTCNSHVEIFMNILFKRGEELFCKITLILNNIDCTVIFLGQFCTGVFFNSSLIKSKIIVYNFTTREKSTLFH